MDFKDGDETALGSAIRVKDERKSGSCCDCEPQMKKGLEIKISF